MARLAVVGGHSMLGTDYACADGRVARGAPATRPARSPIGPAHLVDHVANMRSLVDQGCDRVLAISSVGGLRRELGVGTFLAPDDFIALHTSISIYDDFRGHTVPFVRPGVACARRRRVARAMRPTIAPLEDGGVYWQAFGPRFETPAEIRFIAPVRRRRGHDDGIGVHRGR